MKKFFLSVVERCFALLTWVAHKIKQFFTSSKSDDEAKAIIESATKNIEEYYKKNPGQKRVDEVAQRYFCNE